MHQLQLAALALLWFSLVLTIASASLLFTSVFFNWPINLKHIVDARPTVAEQLPAKGEAAPKTTYLYVLVRDMQTKQSISGAVVEVELLPGKRFTTTSDGGSLIEGIAEKDGEDVRVQVNKEGYAGRDEYVKLPGPKTIYLEKNR
jgi:hypothetical protein